MSFQSFHFIIFLLLIIALNWLLRKNLGARKNMLLCASYYFYMCWDWRYASVMLLLTSINFVAGYKIFHAGSMRGKNTWLGIAIVFSLGILGYFKYVNFFAQSFAYMLNRAGLNISIDVINILMPIGISFFTFQSLSYVLDVHKGKEAPVHSFRDFALFVAFFPTVLSGPITRARQLLPQFDKPLPYSPLRTDEGLYLVVRGFIKKIAFADVLATHIVNPAFDTPGNYSTFFILTAVYAYSFQIYMDLSGYTDIARGVGKMLGFELPENFNRPYLAKTVSSFWQRWHMSMSGFFRDYLFHGVGGSKFGNVYVNLYITFIAIGFWHGAGWNFILYGFIHGTVIVFERWHRGNRAKRGLPAEVEGRIQGLIAMFITFNIVAFSRILFRAPDISAAYRFIVAIFETTSTVSAFNWLGSLALVLSIVLHYLPDRFYHRIMSGYEKTNSLVRAGAIIGIMGVLIAMSNGVSTFIYFRF